MAYVQKHFAGAELQECHNGYIRYQVPSAAGASLADCFDIMEAGKTAVGLEDYSITQTTLEEIFCNFAESGRETDSAVAASDEDRAARLSRATTTSVVNPVYAPSATAPTRASADGATAAMALAGTDSQAADADKDEYLTIYAASTDV